MLMERLRQTWKQYRYRFVPWLAVNLKDRSVRSVPKGTVDKIVADEAVWESLLHLLSAFYTDSSLGLQINTAAAGRRNLSVMGEILGYAVQRCPSSIVGGGTGVRVTAGTIPRGAVTSLYPGLIYEQYEPIFFQSIGNPFIFRCIDGKLIDGNDKGLSKMLYRSCHGRDRIGTYAVCDQSWLTELPLNPLAIGQFVNNQTKENPANVVYQEFSMSVDFPLHLRQYIPNNFYGASLSGNDQLHQRLTRLVALVATREIQCNEELFSSYFTVVENG